MAKQQPKTTRKDKIAAGGKKPDQKPEVKKGYTEKTKGPKPASYAPNRAHKDEVARQAFAKKIADARQEAFGLVRGNTGATYLIGETRNNVTEGHYLEVTEKAFPATGEKEGYSVLMIRGDYPENNPVSIPHAWLFRSAEDLERKRKFAQGFIGQVQREMLQFLQRVLKDQIAEEKYLRYEAALAATPETAQKSDNPIFTLATSEGKKVTKPEKAELISLGNFAPQNFGCYDFRDDTGHTCIVEYFRVSSGKEFVCIKSMQDGHILAKDGIPVGTRMFATHLNKDCNIPPANDKMNAEYRADLVIFREFLIQVLDQVAAKKNRKAA